MIQKLLIISILLMTGSFALPCPTCPQQPLYLPSQEVILSSLANKDKDKVEPISPVGQAWNHYKSAPVIEKPPPADPALTWMSPSTRDKWKKGHRHVLTNHDEFVCDSQRLSQTMSRGKPAIKHFF